MLYDWKFTLPDHEIDRTEREKSFEKDWHEGIKHFHLLSESISSDLLKKTSE